MNGSGQGGFDDPSDNLIGIRDDRARFGSRHERPIGTIGAIGERLARASETSGSSGGDELRSREPKQDERRVYGRGRARHGVGDGTISSGHMVQSSVWLDVLEPNALSGRNLNQRTHLGGDEHFNFGGRQSEVTPPESRPIGERRVSADGDSVRMRETDGGLHQLQIARVTSTGDIGRRYERHHLRVIPDAFANVGVQIDSQGVTTGGQPCNS